MNEEFEGSDGDSVEGSLEDSMYALDSSRCTSDTAYHTAQLGSRRLKICGRCSPAAFHLHGYKEQRFGGHRLSMDDQTSSERRMHQAGPSGLLRYLKEHIESCGTGSV